VLPDTACDAQVERDALQAVQLILRDFQDDVDAIIIGCTHSWFSFHKRYTVPQD
jgi:glutamate racemase